MRNQRSNNIPFVKIRIEGTDYTFVHHEDLEVFPIANHNLVYNLNTRPVISYTGGFFYDYAGSSFSILNPPNDPMSIFKETDGTWPPNRSQLYNCEIGFFPTTDTTPIFLGQARIMSWDVNAGLPKVTFKIQPLNPIEFKFFSDLFGEGITTIEDYRGARTPLVFTIGRFSRVPFTILRSTSDTILDNTAGATFNESIVVYNDGKVYAVTNPSVDLVTSSTNSFAIVLKGNVITQDTTEATETTSVSNLETAQGHITTDNNDAFFPSNIGSGSIYETVPQGVSIQDNFFPGSNGGNAWALYTKQFTGDHDKTYEGSRTRSTNVQNYRSSGLEIYDPVSVTSATGTVTGGVLRVVRNSGISGNFAQGQQITFRSTVGLFEVGLSYNIDNINGSTFDLPLQAGDTLSGAHNFDYSFNAFGGIDTNQIIGFERVGATPEVGTQLTTSYTGTTAESRTGNYSVTYSNYNAQNDPAVTEVGYSSSVQGTHYDFPNSTGLGWVLAGATPGSSPGLTARWSPSSFSETHVHNIPAYTHSTSNYNTGAFDTALNGTTYTSGLSSPIVLNEELYYYTFAQSTWVLSVPTSSITITRAENRINPDIPSSEFTALRNALFNTSTSTTGSFATSGIGTLVYGSRSVGIQIRNIRIVNNRIYFVTNSPIDLPDFQSMSYQFLSATPIGSHSIPNADQTHTINISVSNASAQGHFNAVIEPQNTGAELSRSFYSDTVVVPTTAFNMTGQSYARRYGTTTGGGLNDNGQNRTNHTRTQSGSIPGVDTTYVSQVDADSDVYFSRDYDERTIGGTFNLSSRNLNTLITEEGDTMRIQALGFDTIGEVTVDAVSKIIEVGTIDNILQYIATQLQEVEYELFPGDVISTVDVAYDTNANIVKDFEVINKGFTNIQTFKELLDEMASFSGLQFGYEFKRVGGLINMTIRCNFAHGVSYTPIRLYSLDQYSTNPSPTQATIPQVLLAYTETNSREGSVTEQKEVVVQFGYNNFPDETFLQEPIGGTTVRVDHNNTRYTSVNQSDQMRTLLQGKFEQMARPTDRISIPGVDLGLFHGDIIEADSEILGTTETYRIVGISAIDTENKQMNFSVEIVNSRPLANRR